MAIKDLGAVTAYAYAVMHGYTGTEEQFEIAMAALPGKVSDAQDKIDEIAAFNVEVTTGAAGSQASASYNHANSKLSLTIPRGDTGEISQEFVDEHLAYNDGYYEEMTVGGADQIVTDIQADDDKIYTFRTTGGSLDVGDRKTEELIGGTVAWNQLSKAQITHDTNGVTITSNSDGSVTINGTTNASGTLGSHQSFTCYKDHVYLLLFDNEFIKAGAGLYTNIGGNIASTSSMIRKATATSNGAYACLRSDSGKTYDHVNGYVCSFDLTQMFGSTIAEYILALNTATPGAGVAWFKKYFPKSYYAYDPGSLQSVNIAAGVNTGFNQWDEEWEKGLIDTTTGVNTSSNNNIRSKNYISILPSTAYYFNAGSVGMSVNGAYYDADKNYISALGGIANSIFTTPSNAHYMRFYLASAYGTTYKNDICINLSWDGSRDGEYEPYDAHVYNYDSDLQLRGIPSLDEFGNLQYDGDIYSSDGSVKRKYGIVDLGTLTWTRTTNYTNAFFYVGLNYIKHGAKIKNAKYKEIEIEGASYFAVNASNLDIASSGNSKQIFIRDDTYTDAATFKTAMSGVYLVYELATPTEESADPFTSPQVINDFGTEEWVDAGVQAETRDVTIPVGHNSGYQVNLKAKLEMAPNSPDGDGEYLVRQKNGENEYIPFTWTGDHLDLTAGSAHQLISTVQENDQTPYLFRTSGGSVDIGDREYIDAIIGGTIAWNQQVNATKFTNVTSGVSTTTANGDGSITLVISGTPENEESIPLTNNTASSYFKVPYNHKYIIFDSNIKPTGIGYKNNYNGTALGWNTIRTQEQASGYIYLGLRVLTSAVAGTYTLKPQIFDLTQMFGSAVADYIYSLETATAGAGVAFFKKLFPKPYYAYNAGELMSVSGLQSHNMTGFNQLDSTPTYISNTTALDKSTAIKVLPNVRYRFSFSGIGSATSWRRYLKVWDLDGNLFQNVPYSQLFDSKDLHGETTFVPYWHASNSYIDGADTASKRLYLTFTGEYYIQFYFGAGNTSSSMAMKDACLNIVWDGSRDGEYEPYELHSYNLDSDLTLRGVPCLDSSNNLYYDGDTYESDGTVTRKYGIVDLGTLTWGAASGTTKSFYTTNALSPAMKVSVSGGVNMVCSKYRYGGGAGTSTEITSAKDKAIYYDWNSLGKIIIMDTAYANTSTADFKTAMSGVYLVYELATPTTEEADPYQNPQIVDDFGTEEYVIDPEIAVPISVGHNTRYTANLKAKLEMAPNSPDGDGDYILRQNNGENEYVPLIFPTELPDMPTADGSYRLVVTVSDGTPTLGWVSNT